MQLTFSFFPALLSIYDFQAMEQGFLFEPEVMARTELQDAIARLDYSERLHPDHRAEHAADPYSFRRCVTDERSRTSPPFCARSKSASRFSAREIRYPRDGRGRSR